MNKLVEVESDLFIGGFFFLVFLMCLLGNTTLAFSIGIRATRIVINTAFVFASNSKARNCNNLIGNTRTRWM